MNTLKRGLKVGLQTTWTLGKIIFPITLFVRILSQTPLMDWLVKILSPLMGLIGLPGEAAIPLVLGNFSNLYAAIGAILSLDLSVKSVFILAVMLSFSHNLFIESSVAGKVGIKIWVVLCVRLGLAITSAIIISLVWHGGNEPAQYGLVPQQTEITGAWNIILHGLEQGFFGVLQLAAIVIPLMVFIQIMKDLSLLDHFAKWMSPFTRLLGMEKNTSTTLAAGLAFGLAYGAGVMLQAVKEDGVAKRDLYLVFIFLVGCHAVIEDTLIFAPLGIPVWALLLIRLGVATLITVIVAPVLNRINWDIKELQGKEDVSVGN